MEQEVRELLEQRYARREDLLKAIRGSWRELPPSSAKEVARWIAGIALRRALAAPTGFGSEASSFELAFDGLAFVAPSAGGRRAA